MLKEFKEFIMKGNVVDLAVAVIIGGAFNLIVKSLVDDIIMPIVGAITGGVDFSNLFIPLSDSVTATTLAEAKKQGAVLAYGNFITVTVNFLIVAFVIFLCLPSRRSEDGAADFASGRIDRPKSIARKMKNAAGRNRRHFLSPRHEARRKMDARGNGTHLATFPRADKDIP